MTKYLGNQSKTNTHRRIGAFLDLASPPRGADSLDSEVSTAASTRMWREGPRPIRGCHKEAVLTAYSVHFAIQQHLWATSKTLSQIRNANRYCPGLLCANPGWCGRILGRNFCHTWVRLVPKSVWQHLFLLILHRT